MSHPVIVYAPSAHHGVTTLMAVGKDDALGASESLPLDYKRAAVVGVVGFVVGGRKLGLLGAAASLVANLFGK